MIRAHREIEARYGRAPLSMNASGTSWARVSTCGRYRYALGRSWTPSLPTMVVIGVNPSTADALTDDPTIRRCVGFARDSGHGELLMINLFAWRSKDVADLAAVEDPAGPDADAWLDEYARRGMVVWASGPPTKVPPRLRARFETVRDRLRAVTTLHALAFTASGWPSHPLYLPATCRPVVWP